MRTKSLILLTLAVLTLAAGCHRKGGGYLAPTPANTSVSR
jgi:predicted small lipoprotein YifL